MKRRVADELHVALTAALLAMAAVGCATPQAASQADKVREAGDADARSTGDHPEGDHPKGDHPKGDHPKGDHPKGDHPKGDHPKGDHPKGDHPTSKPTEGGE